MDYPDHYDTEAVLRCKQDLLQAAQEQENQTISDLFRQDPDRVVNFSLAAAGLHLDYSKTPLTEGVRSRLCQLANSAGLKALTEATFSGQVINHTEKRAVLHTALRGDPEEPVWVDGNNIKADVTTTLDRMEAFVEKVSDGQWLGFDGREITDIVSIGIGGSYLGPRVAIEALRPYWEEDLRCHFVSNIDAADLATTLEDLTPATTLFIIQSKSFKTQETLTNAESARDWFLKGGGESSEIGKHFVAVSSNVALAREFGIEESNIFPMWDWVGGRYSLWSAIGLPVALQVGMANFRKLLAGARAMDEHFREAPAEENMPVILALLGIWYQNFLGASSCAVIPYDQSLENLPAHLQQVDMESNGKTVDRSGNPVSMATGVVLWGGAGTNGQHAYHQLLHQGGEWIPVDFILPLKSHYPIGRHHAMLASNCLAQAQALMHGKSLESAMQELQAAGLSVEEAQKLAPHKVIPGNRPSHLITLEKLTPETLGSLIALYEHRVFVQGAIWDLNSFDQWGVELGKQLCDSLLPLLESPDASLQALDASTAAAVQRFRESSG